jgi:hypothetical protein
MEDKALIKHYLLGRLSEEDQVRVESRYFVDDDFLEELRACEFDLIDDYLAGNLSEEDKRFFEEFFLSLPGNQEKLENARLLVTAKSRITATSKPNPWWRKLFDWLSAFSAPSKLAWGIAFLLIAALGATLIIKTLKSSPPSQVVRVPEPAPEQPVLQPVPQQTTPQDQKVAQAPQPIPTSSQPRSRTLMLSLSPIAVRSSHTERNLVITPEIKTVLIKLTSIEGEYQAFKASIQKPDGTEVFQAGNVQTKNGRSGLESVITIPAQKLPTGEFLLILQGTPDGKKYEHVTDYQFRVSRN